VEPVSIRLTGGGIEHAEGSPSPAPCLYVARTEYGWPLVHVRSGLLVGTYDDPEVAVACAIDLGGMWDWARPAVELHMLPYSVKKTIIKTCRRWGPAQVPYLKRSMTCEPMQKEKETCRKPQLPRFRGSR